MIARGLLTVFLMGFGAIVLISMFPAFVENTESTRTQDATASLSCTTGSGETECDLFLPTEHEYPDTSSLTVTETSPGSGDVTDDITVGDDRQTLTWSNLSGTTSYDADVDYQEQSDSVDSRLNGLLRITPVLVILGFFVLAVLTFAGFKGVRS